MNAPKPSRLKQYLARVCMKCPVCRRARRTQQGAAYEMVKKVEGKICPFCRAYAEVTGKMPHEPE